MEQSTEGETLVQEDEEVKEPEEYRVILLNDDYTTMEFVVAVIITIFHKGLAEATTIMMDVHKKGRGIVGIYAFDIATTKVEQVHRLAQDNGYPLKCVMEKA